MFPPFFLKKNQKMKKIEIKSNSNYMDISVCKSNAENKISVGKIVRTNTQRIQWWHKGCAEHIQSRTIRFYCEVFDITKTHIKTRIVDLDCSLRGGGKVNQKTHQEMHNYFYCKEKKFFNNTKDYCEVGHYNDNCNSLHLAEVIFMQPLGVCHPDVFEKINN